MISEKNKGTLIKNVEEIYDLAMNKECIYNTRPCGRIPAAILINWPGHLLVQKIRQGDLYTYVRSNKSSRYGNVENLTQKID